MDNVCFKRVLNLAKTFCVGEVLRVGGQPEPGGNDDTYRTHHWGTHRSSHYATVPTWISQFRSLRSCSRAAYASTTSANGIV